MRRIHNYQIVKESLERMRQAGRYNPALRIIFRDKKGLHSHSLSAGYSDDIYVYREGTVTYVLTKNDHLGYVGLELFEGSDRLSDMFINDYQVEETIGSFDLAPYNIIKRLEPYMN